MVRRTRPADLAALARLARLRSDREMHKFAVFRQNMTALEVQIGQLQASLLAGYPAGDAFSLIEARRSHAMTRAAALDLRRCEGELLMMRPHFEQARQQAMREFGRAEVLARLHLEARSEQRAQRDRVSESLSKGPGF